MKKIIVIVSIFLLSGCTSLLSPVSQPPTKMYLLSVGHAQHAPTKNNQGKVLLVSMPSAPVWLNTNKMAYQLQPNQIDYFAYHQWVATPAELLQPLIIEKLQQTHRYRAVLSSTTEAIDQRLDVRVLAMQQEFFVHPSVYKMSWQVTLTDVHTQHIIFSKVLTAKVSATADNPDAGALAADKAVGILLSKL